LHIHHGTSDKVGSAKGSCSCLVFRARVRVAEAGCRCLAAAHLSLPPVPGTCGCKWRTYGCGWVPTCLHGGAQPQVSLLPKALMSLSPALNLLCSHPTLCFSYSVLYVSASISPLSPSSRGRPLLPTTSTRYASPLLILLFSLYFHLRSHTLLIFLSSTKGGILYFYLFLSFLGRSRKKPFSVFNTSKKGRMRAKRRPWTRTQSLLPTHERR